MLRHRVRELAGQVRSCDNMERSDFVGSSFGRNPLLRCRRGRRAMGRTSKQIIRVWDCFLSLS